MRRHSAETERLIAELWDQGLSATKIGQQLDLTKNSVISIARRLKLPARETPIQQKKNQVRGVINASKAAARRSRSKGVPLGRGMADAVWRPKTCQFIHGEPSADPDYCGAAVTPGSPYCAEHHALTHQGVQAKDREEAA